MIPSSKLLDFRSFLPQFTNLDLKIEVGSLYQNYGILLVPMLKHKET
jgi:hypothetical protein